MKWSLHNHLFIISNKWLSSLVTLPTAIVIVILLINYFNHFRAPHITSRTYNSLIIYEQFLSHSMPFFSRLKDRIFSIFYLWRHNQDCVKSMNSFFYYTILKPISILSRHYSIFLFWSLFLRKPPLFSHPLYCMGGWTKIGLCKSKDIEKKTWLLNHVHMLFGWKRVRWPFFTWFDDIKMELVNSQRGPRNI
jgi:hypothetical protein